MTASTSRAARRRAPRPPPRRVLPERRLARLPGVRGELPDELRGELHARRRDRRRRRRRRELSSASRRRQPARFVPKSSRRVPDELGLHRRGRDAYSRSSAPTREDRSRRGSPCALPVERLHVEARPRGVEAASAARLVPRAHRVDARLVLAQGPSARRGPSPSASPPEEGSARRSRRAKTGRGDNLCSTWFVRASARGGSGRRRGRSPAAPSAPVGRQREVTTQRAEGRRCAGGEAPGAGALATSSSASASNKLRATPRAAESLRTPPRAGEGPRDVLRGGGGDFRRSCPSGVRRAGDRG